MQNLKFHHPKKDTCGIYEVFRSTPEPKTPKLLDEYCEHEQEKVISSQLLASFREEAKNNSKFRTAIFDLQMVLYLPQSKCGEIFYKRLSCFNLTIYDTNKQGHCLFWHEGIALRGANELASCLYLFLVDLDKEGVESLALFYDGCSGQNKNSIIPIMLRVS